MIVLHATFFQDRLRLWGERIVPEEPADDVDDDGGPTDAVEDVVGSEVAETASGETAETPAEPADASDSAERDPDAPPPPLPFDADEDLLEATIKRAELEIDLAVTSKKRSPILWLPTQGDMPLPSVARPEEGDEPPVIAPWSVQSCSLGFEEAFPLLVAAREKTALATGIQVGASLAYWARALQLAAGLVARESFLPTVEAVSSGVRGKWVTVLSGDDRASEIAFATSMPPVARAMSGQGEPPPDVPATIHLRKFLDWCVDNLVRLPGAGSSLALGPESSANPHQAWLQSLRAIDSKIRIEARKARELVDQVRRWRRPVEVLSTSPVHLWFQLEEPELPEGGDFALERPVDGKDAADEPIWFVRFLLQVEEGETRPLDKVWDEKGEGAELHRAMPHLREFLLSSLGQASTLCEPIARTLQEPDPIGFTMSTREAHAFLSLQALALEQSGFGVTLPSWWTRRGTRSRLAARALVKTPEDAAQQARTLDDTLEVEWELTFDGSPLTLDQLRELAESRSPLVRLRGHWLEIDGARLERTLEFWESERTQKVGARELLMLSLGARRGPAGLEISEVSASGWVRSLFDGVSRDSLDELEPPETFDGTLRPYQVRGFSWLSFLRSWRLGACLADDMGLGKTVQTLVLLERARLEGTQHPSLLVCPTSVLRNWQLESSRFTPELKTLVHHGPDRAKGEAFAEAAKGIHLIITSYGLLVRDREQLEAHDWETVILDEAQNIKNPTTRQSQAARAVPAAHRIALTGTPVENHVGDLWSIMEFLNPGLLGTQGEFRERFLAPIQAQRDEGRTRLLQRITGPFVLRRLKTDKQIISDLPEKLEMKVYCTLTDEQSALYAQVIDELNSTLYRAEGIRRKGLVLAALTKLKQICNHPAHYLGETLGDPARSGKLERLNEMLEEIHEVGDRALIFTQFTKMGHLLVRTIQERLGREIPFLHGGLSRTQRDRMVQRFQDDDDGPPVFVLSLKAGGTGLNLTRAQHVFHFDRWWNPAVEDQATDRAFRIGQTRRVQVHKFLCTGTLEERIDRMIERKKEVASLAIGAGESWLTELSDDELREILELRSEVLGAGDAA